ncbi:MAG: holo-ACP synthase [Luteolibacter sp.]|jgi:holo-[acyl-carrier protein] synthase
MNIHGIGIDIVEVARISAANARHGTAFVERYLTANERAYCAAHANPEIHQAARFAAKEAVAKALGTGIGGECGWLDIEITRDAATGAPGVVLAGAAADFAANHGITRIFISLSHTRETAVAYAIATREMGI